MRPEQESEGQCGHAHCHDDTRRSALQHLHGETGSFPSLDRKPVPAELLEEYLQQPRHRAQPEGEHDHDMLRLPHGFLCTNDFFDGRRNKVSGVAQDRGAELADINSRNHMPSRRGAVRIGVGKGMAEMLLIGVRMALQDTDGSRHVEPSH